MHPYSMLEMQVGEWSRARLQHLPYLAIGSILTKKNL
jgi:hypothetical protein